MCRKLVVVNELYFWQCTSKWVALDIKRNKDKYCGSQNKVRFLATIVSNVSTIIYRRKCNGIFKTGRAFLITLSPEKHKKNPNPVLTPDSTALQSHPNKTYERRKSNEREHRQQGKREGGFQGTVERSCKHSLTAGRKFRANKGRTEHTLCSKSPAQDIERNAGNVKRLTRGRR